MMEVKETGRSKRIHDGKKARRKERKGRKEE